MYAVDVVMPNAPRDMFMMRNACIYIRMYADVDMVGQGSECVHGCCGGAECGARVWGYCLADWRRQLE